MDAASRFHDKVSPEPMSGCWLWTACCSAQGYGRLGSERAHRAAWRLFRGPIPDGADVLHRCDVKACVNPDHLYLGDDFDNQRDVVSRQRRRVLSGDEHWSRRRPDRLARGNRHPASKDPAWSVAEANGNARLTWELVGEIRARAASGESTGNLSSAFGVTRTHVRDVVSGKRWRAN